MANEMRIRYTASGEIGLYAILMDRTTGYVHNGSTFETPVTANWDNYDKGLTEQSTTQWYYGNLPSLTEGKYEVSVYRKVGGTVAPSDDYLGTIPFDWRSGEVSTLESAPSNGYPSGFSSLTVANIGTQVATELGTYDSPTKAELDAAVTTITTAIPTPAENADGLLGRNIAGGSNSGRIVTEALQFLRNRWTRDINSGSMTVYEEDDTTVSWTSTITVSASSKPIIESNPA